MRYFLTLPFAALALAATPAMAQDTATPPEAATTQSPPTDPMAQPTAMPPADAATPATPATPTGTGPATPATPANPVASKLTAEQQAAYDAWPAETKVYFDGLPPGRQQLFLRVTDNDKGKLAALPAAQQETVWASLEKQAAAAPKAN